jgi:transcriptional regulator with XRE-family HTH domain
MTDTYSPAQLRSMFGANLRELAQREKSISALCRNLGINRTQFNRYLSCDSFPRPDILHRICEYFGVDARILLEPLSTIGDSNGGPLNHEAVAAYLGASTAPVPEDAFPDGFYRFVRRSFSNDALFVQGLIYVFRADGHCFLRGYEARQAMLNQGLPTDGATREFRGAILPQEDGVTALVSRLGAATATVNYLARIPSFENNFWLGYTARPVRENVAGPRFQRLVYEHLGRKRARIMAAARATGFCSEADLIPYHRQLLEPERPMS